MVFHGRNLDEPTVERIVEHRFVGTPTVRIVVHVFFNLIDCASGLHFHTDEDVEILGLLCGLLVVLSVDGELRVVGVLHPTAFVFLIDVVIDKIGDKLRVKVGCEIVFTSQIDHWTSLASLVNHKQRRNASGLCHLGVVGTESWCNVDNARTVFGGYIVARDDAEGVGFLVHNLLVVSQFARVNPREQLLVMDAHKVGALHFGNDVARVLVVEIGAETRFCHHHRARLLGVGVLGLNSHVVDFRTNAERGVRWQGPRCCGPGQNIKLLVVGVGFRQNILNKFVFSVSNLELCGAGGVLHVAVATRLVQLVSRKACSRSGRVRLNGVALVEQPFVIDGFKQIPKSLDVAVVVGDVGVVHIHPIAHFGGQVAPLGGVFHNLRTAGAVVVVNADFLADILFGDAQLLLDAQLNRQSVSVPTSLAVDQETLQSLVAADYILNAACHNVVNTWHSVGRRRPFEEDEFRMSGTCVDTFLECVLAVPFGKDVLIDL